MIDPGKTRNLKDINHIFKSFPALQSIVSDLLVKKNSADVLEVGFGWGRALVELAWHFRNTRTTFYGVDAKRKPPIEHAEDLRGIARQFELVPDQSLRDFPLPSLFFYDATTLHFNDESLDCIYSVVTIRFMRDKMKFVEEVCRVLRPGGCAFLHLGEANWDYPYSTVSDSWFLTPFTSRLLLLHEQELIPLSVFLRLFSGTTFDFHVASGSRCTLLINKRQSGRVHFNLSVNEALTKSGRELPLRDRRGEIRSGIRTVYDIPAPLYRDLHGQGLLSHDQLQPALHLPPDWNNPS